MQPLGGEPVIAPIGGGEIWIMLAVILIIFGPILLIALVVWLLVRRRSRVAGPQIPAGWLADPTGRHELRYWSGTAWTTQVSDAGERSEDLS
jgi:hypothetical protein